MDLIHLPLKSQKWVVTEYVLPQAPSNRKAQSNVPSFHPLPLP